MNSGYAHSRIETFFGILKLHYGRMAKPDTLAGSVTERVLVYCVGYNMKRWRIDSAG